MNKIRRCAVCRDVARRYVVGLLLDKPFHGYACGQYHAAVLLAPLANGAAYPLEISDYEATKARSTGRKLAQEALDRRT